MATDPRQEKIMQFARMIRQMGAPTTPPGGTVVGLPPPPIDPNYGAGRVTGLPTPPIDPNYGMPRSPGILNLLANREAAVVGPPPGGYQQTRLSRPSDMSDELWQKYLARISATNQTANAYQPPPDVISVTPGGGPPIVPSPPLTPPAPPTPPPMSEADRNRELMRRLLQGIMGNQTGLGPGFFGPGPTSPPNDPYAF